MGSKGYFLLLLYMGLLLPLPCGAVDIHGRSSTQVLWFINDFNNHRQVDIAQYIMLNVTKIDKEEKFSIYGYGRGVQDLNNGEGTSGRLYYLYGEYRDLFDKADIRIGRQFVNISAGSAIIDGIHTNLKNIGPVGFTTFGGRDVVFGVDGEISHEGNYVVGLSAYLLEFRKTQLDVSWFRKWDSGDVAQDIVGGSFNQYLFNNIRLYANARYDLIAEVFNEVLTGVKYFPTANLIFTGEWYQSYPTFDATDIFSVFAVNRYQEWVFRGDCTINDYVGLHAGYTRQSFGDGEDGNLVEAGVLLHPIENLSLDLSYDWQHGYGGRVDGFIIDASYDASKEVQFGAGMAYDVYKRDFYPSSTGNETAQRYWIGGKYKFAKNMSAYLRIDDLETDARNSSDVQGRFIFNYDF
ncbi:MAG: hypothetical protein H6Q57_2414 [Geobacteraceae bacterium]|nr:hypothetical protein [Geobacteraceae bacterium]